jgi:ABC-type glycerol-3-phosphate transport system permease component
MTTQASSARRRKIVRTILGRGAIYAFLSLFALLMVFPFLYMAASSLKTPADTFRYPPRILPRQAEVLEVGGEELPLYRLPIEGAERDVVLVESGIPAGVFVDPDDATVDVVWPLDLVAPTGTTVSLDGEEAEVFTVPVDDTVAELALSRTTSVGRFQVPDDPDAVTYAVVRTAPAAETITARWQNFSDVLELRSLDRALSNTILVTILVVAGILFTSIMGGYAFARIRFPGRTAIFLAYLGSIMIPFIVVIVPLFQLMVSLGWIDHLGVLTWPFIFNAYGTFLMRQFFVSIPKDLEEAAVIDGAKRWRILWQVFVPLSWPAIATLGTFSFLYAWNSFVWPLVAINTANTEDWVLTIALRQLGGQSVESPNLIFAGVVIAVIVPMAIFIAAQRYFVENVATSGIK